MVANGNPGIKMFVYALCEPDGKTIRYIGVTANLRKRLNQHLGKPLAPKVREWIDSLRERGLIPAMIVLRECFGVENGVLAEAEEIRRHFASGNLLNVLETPNAVAPQRRHGKLSFGGKSQTLAQWAKELGISRQALHQRLEFHAPDVALSRGKDAGIPLVENNCHGKTHHPAVIGSEEFCVHVAAKTGLTHPERRERRKKMAEMLSSGSSCEQVAATFGVTTATVEAARKEFNTAVA